MKNYKTKRVLAFVFSLVKAVFVDDELEITSLLFIKRINTSSIRKISISLNMCHIYGKAFGLIVTESSAN